MDFDEALNRFSQTDKQKAEELAERERRKKRAGKGKAPPGSKVDRKNGDG